MSRQPHHTPRSRPRVLDDEPDGPPTPRNPPDAGDVEAARELQIGAIREFLRLGGAEHGIGIVMSWDDRLERHADRLDALEREAKAHELAAQTRDRQARERHIEILEILSHQGTTIGAQGAALAASAVEARRASLADRAELATVDATPGQSTWPAAVAQGLRSKRAIAALVGAVLAIVGILDQLGILAP